tara:strand:+ start:4198 stop:6105 length:1908 start_codon:yes stop_codon:yes gene_type:complete
MSLVNVSSLDFDEIKESIKSYLRADGSFTDYDFEGSNFTVLLDTLAYNTYISSYNANMLTNEVFLDGATLRENVVSIARNLGYIPRSVTSARGVISFYLDLSSFATNPVSVTLKKGIVATSAGSYAGRNYVFTIPEDITVPVSGNVASFDEVTIYEGAYVQNTFTVDSNNKNQKFILQNARIDTSQIRVEVRENRNSNITRVYKRADNLTAIKSTDDVFFINEIADSRYELIFGDGSFGSKLNNANYIVVTYIVTNGERANGINKFSFTGRFIDNNGSPIKITSPLVETIQGTAYGAPIESTESIKKLAPRVYASQNRAVTANDYEALIPQIYPEAESVSVFGGEELNPPKYGKVFITVKPQNGSYLPNIVKDNIKTLLRGYSVAGIVPEFIDLKYLYIEYYSNVYYNQNLGSADGIKSLVARNIEKYAASDELNRYGSRFKYSKFLKLIDDTSAAITSNITSIAIRRDVKLVLNVFSENEICFGNKIHIKNQSGYNIKTSGVQIEGIEGTVYFSDFPTGQGLTGVIFAFKLDASSQPIIVRQNVGIVDYERGEIKLNALNFVNTSKLKFGDNVMEVSIIPKSNDIIGLQDLYLQLDTTTSDCKLISDVISSGADLSGSQYIVSSSYLNGAYVRL